MGKAFITYKTSRPLCLKAFDVQAYNCSASILKFCVYFSEFFQEFCRSELLTQFTFSTVYCLAFYGHDTMLAMHGKCVCSVALLRSREVLPSQFSGFKKFSNLTYRNIFQIKARNLLPSKRFIFQKLVFSLSSASFRLE